MDYPHFPDYASSTSAPFFPDEIAHPRHHIVALLGTLLPPELAILIETFIEPPKLARHALYYDGQRQNWHGRHVHKTLGPGMIGMGMVHMPPVYRDDAAALSRPVVRHVWAVAVSLDLAIQGSLNRRTVGMDEGGLELEVSLMLYTRMGPVKEFIVGRARFYGGGVKTWWLKRADMAEWGMEHIDLFLTDRIVVRGVPIIRGTATVTVMRVELAVYSI